MIHAVDKKGKTHDINLERIISEFKSQTYDGQFDDTLKKLFIWITYPIIDPEKNVGFVMANNIDEANYIISLLDMQDKIFIDDMCTLNVYRMYDWLLTNVSLLKHRHKEKTFLFTNTSDGKTKKGIVVAKTKTEAKRILMSNGIDVNGSVTYDEFDPKKTNFVVFD